MKFTQSEIRKRFKYIGYEVSFKSVSFVDLARGKMTSVKVLDSDRKSIYRQFFGSLEERNDFCEKHKKAYELIDEIKASMSGFTFS